MIIKSLIHQQQLLVKLNSIDIRACFNVVIWGSAFVLTLYKFAVNVNHFHVFTLPVTGLSKALTNYSKLNCVLSNAGAWLSLFWNMLWKQMTTKWCNFPAEFIIHLAEKHPTFEKFQKALTDKGANFSVCLSKYLRDFSLPLIEKKNRPINGTFFLKI